MQPTEQLRSGLQYLETISTFLQRARAAHPWKGLYEAADLQWWWGRPRATDASQLFWFDAHGEPEAAAILTDWTKAIALDVMVLPDASPDTVAHVLARGLAHARELGYPTVQMEVARDDGVLREVLANHGFSIKEDGLFECWLAADDRPTISPLADGYRLCSRVDTMEQPHHMINRSGPDIEQRLHQTSLYRPEFDLLILDGDGNCAANGLFWYDPATATGLVEPMRTEDDHQRRGLARHILTTGVDLLSRAGASRIKICFEADNPASSHLYLSVGFEPVKQTDVFAN